MLSSTKINESFLSIILLFGHVFSNVGISADPEDQRDNKSFSPATNAAKISSFLGMTRYVARFISHYAVLTEPLCVGLKGKKCI